MEMQIIQTPNGRRKEYLKRYQRNYYYKVRDKISEKYFKKKQEEIVLNLPEEITATDVDDNLKRAQEGRPLTRSLRELNKNWNFKRMYDRLTSKEYGKQWRDLNAEHLKTYLKEYYAKPAVKKRMKEAQKRYYYKPGTQEKRKLYYQRPEVIERRKKYAKEYYSKPEVSAKMMAYQKKRYHSDAAVRERIMKRNKAYGKRVRLEMSLERKIELRKKARERMKRVRLEMSPEKKEVYRRSNRERMRRVRLEMSPEKKIEYLKKAKERVKRARLEMSPEEKIELRKKDRDRMRRTRLESQWEHWKSKLEEQNNV